MGNIVSFREYSILKIDDEISYRLEEIEMILTDEYFDKFLDYIDKLSKKDETLMYPLDENTAVFYIDVHIDEYFKNCPKDVQHIINRIHQLTKEVTDLLKRRLLIKVMNGEAIEWIGRKKEKKNKGVIFLTLDDFDQLTFFKFRDIFTSYDELPIKYRLNESEYGTFLSVKRKLETVMTKNPDLDPEAILKRVPKLKSKQKNNI